MTAKSPPQRDPTRRAMVSQNLSGFNATYDVPSR